MHYNVLDSTLITTGSTYTSGPYLLHRNDSAFALYYSIAGATASCDFYYYASADGENFVKKSFSIKNSATVGSDVVVFAPQACEAIKIEVVSNGAGDATVTCSVVIRTGVFGDLGFLTLDGTTKSLQTIDYAHHEVHAGSHFFVVGYADLSINQVLDFTWQMPNTTKWIHWSWSIDTKAETLWQVYENVVATNALANAVTPLNSNRNSSTASVTTMKFEVQANLVAANVDTNVTGATLIESGIAGAGRNAGSSSREDEIIMDQNVLYCLRATATAAGYINFKMSWYEHTNR